MAESYFQHAEHYWRIVLAAQEQMAQQFGTQFQPQRPFGDEGDDGDDEGDDEGGAYPMGPSSRRAPASRAMPGDDGQPWQGERGRDHRAAAGAATTTATASALTGTTATTAASTAMTATIRIAARIGTIRIATIRSAAGRAGRKIGKRTGKRTGKKTAGEPQEGRHEVIASMASASRASGSGATAMTGRAGSLPPVTIRARAAKA